MKISKKVIREIKTESIESWGRMQARKIMKEKGELNQNNK
jgi:hypothetical protein